MQGSYNVVDDSTVEITELPVSTWIREYKNFIETLIEKNEVKDIREFHTENRVHFILEGLEASELSKDDFIKKFKLETRIDSTNMVLFDSKGLIRKYASPLDIITEFCDERIKVYEKRKTYLENKLKSEVALLKNKNRFIQEMIDETLNIRKKKKDEIENLLKSKGYQTKQEIDSILKPTSTTDAPYDYLLSMSFSSLSEEKCEELEGKTINKTKELEALLKRKPIDLWREDLNEFVDAYKDYESKELEEMFNAYQAVCKKANIKCQNRDIKPTFIGKRRRLDSSVSKSKSSKSASKALKKKDKPSIVNSKEKKTNKRKKISENSEISIKSSDLSSIDDSSFEISSSKNIEKPTSKKTMPKGKPMPDLSLNQNINSNTNGKNEEEKNNGSDSNKENNDISISPAEKVKTQK